MTPPTLTDAARAALEAINSKQPIDWNVFRQLEEKGLTYEWVADADSVVTQNLTRRGSEALAASQQQPAADSARVDGGGEEQTFAELCHREIVKIRELTLKDDEYTGGLLGEAVGSPTGITMCVEARMKQIADLQVQVKTLNMLNEKLIKQVAKLKRTADLDDGFIDYLTTKDGE